MKKFLFVCWHLCWRELFLPKARLMVIPVPMLPVSKNQKRFSCPKKVYFCRFFE